jgi:hypothetical protein
MKAELIESKYVLFLEINTLFQIEPPLNIEGGVGQIAKLPAGAWFKVDAALGKEVKKRGIKDIPPELETRLYNVEGKFPNKYKFPVLVGPY